MALSTSNLAGHRPFSFPSRPHAALQVHWTAPFPARLGRERIALLDVPGICPCCGFPPVRQYRPHRGRSRQATLSALWPVQHAVASCPGHLRRLPGTATGIAYRSIEGGDEAVRTETCDACRGYLKIFRQDRGA